jgi:hypothetical protein
MSVVLVQETPVRNWIGCLVKIIKQHYLFFPNLPNLSKNNSNNNCKTSIMAKTLPFSDETTATPPQYKQKLQ